MQVQGLFFHSWRTSFSFWRCKVSHTVLCMHIYALPCKCHMKVSNYAIPSFLNALRKSILFYSISDSMEYQPKELSHLVPHWEWTLPWNHLSKWYSWSYDGWNAKNSVLDLTHYLTHGSCSANPHPPSMVYSMRVWLKHGKQYGNGIRKWENGNGKSLSLCSYM